MSYIQDPNDPNKQVPAPVTYPNTSFIPVFDTDAAAKVANPAIGTMTFSTEQTNGTIFIYTGTKWVKVAGAAL